MKYLILSVVVGGVALAGLPGWGQTHKVAKQEPVVRAVGVYEWTGDMAKPAASRLIPVSVFIDGQLEDAGVYLGRPIPFALLPGNVYELQDSGVVKGSLDLVYAKHLQAVDEKTGGSEYDDGWFGYGTYLAPTPPKKRPALKPSKTLPVIASSGDSDKPKFATKSDGGATGSGSTPAADPDRPTMQRRTSTTDTSSTQDSSAGNSGSSQGSGSVPADDPDRPTMKRRSSDSDNASTTTAGDSGAASGTGSVSSGSGSNSGNTSASGSGNGSGSGSGSGSVPSDDPDRPTLKRRSPAEAKAQQSGNDIAMVTGPSMSLNDDPDRPSLHHGKPASQMTESDLPKLAGLPSNLHQMVAVSDAANREQHDFARAWDDAAEKAAILQKMQTMAQAQLANYGAGPSSPAKPTAANKTAATKTTASKTRKPAGPAPVALLDETLMGYTLSYGGDPTYIYSAHTDGTGPALRYVMVVAQADALGDLKVAMKNVTDSAHLDRTPEMKFVDVVDVEASNRASLLFELRSQNSRQFALYRLIAANAEQIFLSGSTQ